MSSNPLLSKLKLPGRLFQLPSKGIFYKSGVLADSVKDAEIEVFPLSALAEMKLRSPDLLFSGKALRDICEECIPGILKPEQLISKDVDALFCFLRIVTYGSEMRIKSYHDCVQAKSHDYVVNVENIVSEPNNKCLEFVESIYKTTLSNGQEVKLRPVIFQDMIDMNQYQIQIDKSLNESGFVNENLVQAAAIRDLLSVITEVEGISDHELINEWARRLPRKYVSEIMDYVAKIDQWGFNLTVQLKCKDCDQTYVHNLELDPINFFTG